MTFWELCAAHPVTGVVVLFILSFDLLVVTISVKEWVKR